MQKELAKIKINNNIDTVINKWELVTKNSNSYRDAFNRFIGIFGNLGETQLVRLTTSEGYMSRDLTITLEPKEEDFNEFIFVLRSIMYNNKTNDGLHTNKIGTTIFGRYELDDFEGLWTELQLRNNRENKVR
ncbi:hypothetical protein [Virgibacillus sp. DJP39]|uniref:hypothetical protein n=1 Tax=Virgibacillus sp. DJP39 TaxID=3409790 RepID=UPI003BB7EE32